MSKAKYFNKNRLSLFLDKSKTKIVDFPYMYIESPIQSEIQYNSPMLKGVAHQLKRWPNDLFSSFMTACLIISGLILFAFVTAILCSPAMNNDNCCEYKIFEDERSFNVYFVKEATQIWSKKEFCYIETAARKQPDLNIHLITLMRNSDALNIPEVHFKMTLATQNANIHIADLSIDEFFNKSKLLNTANNLSTGLLLMAARAYLLWNSPGVAMHPNAYCNLLNINKFRKEEKRDYTPNKLITIDPTIDLQATEVQCQAFLGFLLQEISKNATQIYNLKDALHKFCPRIDKCPEVQILDLKSQCSVNVFDCPTVYMTRIERMACSLCDHHVMGSSLYVIVLGFIGTVITALDIIRTINYKLPRISLRHRHNQEVPLTIERDLKLMTSILGIEHYTLIMLGAITEYSMLHMPWLLMQFCVIIVEIIVFFVRFFLDGLHIKRNEILQAIFTLYNWLQVFCLFYRQTRQAM